MPPTGAGPSFAAALRRRLDGPSAEIAQVRAEVSALRNGGALHLMAGAPEIGQRAAHARHAGRDCGGSPGARRNRRASGAPRHRRPCRSVPLAVAVQADGR